MAFGSFCDYDVAEPAQPFGEPVFQTVVWDRLVELAGGNRTARGQTLRQDPAHLLGDLRPGFDRFFRRSGQGSSRRCGADNRGREGMPEPCCLLPQMLPQHLTIGSSKIYIIDVI